MSAGGSKKVIIISLLANFGIAISKLGGALFTGSAAMMAEAVHSFSDCGNQALLLYGGRAAAKGVSEKHPLGRGAELYFWSFIVALLLFSMGGLFSLYEGVHKILHPQPVQYIAVAVSVLVVAVALETFSFMACLKEVRSQNRYGSLWNWVKHTSSADLLVIFLEDLAALLGLVIALAALSTAWITENSIYDGIGSCLIGLLLIGVAVVLGKEIKSLLIGEVSAEDYSDSMKELLNIHMPGSKILKLIAVNQGLNEVLVAYKIKPADLQASTATSIIKLNNFEAAVKLKFPEIRWQFAELDVEE